MDAFKQKAKDMFTTREGALRATAVVAGAAKDMFTTREGALRATAVVAGSAKDMFTTREGALRATAVIAGAACVYFFWPTALATGATMKAPGAAGFVVSRAAFLGNPQLYFQILRTAGAAAAAAAFAPAAAAGAAAYAPAAAAGAAGAAAAYALYGSTEQRNYACMHAERITDQSLRSI